MTANTPGLRLRAAIERQVVSIPGVFNPLVARLAEQQGFQAGYLSGAAFSASGLALPDIGLFTLSELVDETRRLARACTLPLVVDADTGFGEAVNVERTVAELEHAGAAAIQLEDQELPKRCGHLSGKSLVSTEAMCAKLRAAVAARKNPSLVILARTDARGVTDFDEAVARARAYIAAGADWIFPEALATRDEFARFAAAVPVPLVANMTEFGKSPLLSTSELGTLGYRAVLFPVTLLRVAMKAISECLATIAADGTQQAWVGRMQSRQELYDLLGYTNYLARDREHFERQPDLK